MNYADHFSPKQTPQSEPIPGKAQVENNAGGYTFAVDAWTQLDRFLLLGTEGGTFYVGERELTIENAKNVAELAKTNGKEVVDRVLTLIDRAHKKEPALFALALVTAFGSEAARWYAWWHLRHVARTGTQLFTFMSYRRKLAGFGRGARRGLGLWYKAKTPEQLAYQVLKYRQRNGWTHRDVLRLAHPKPSLNAAVIAAVAHPEQADLSKLPRLFEGVARVEAAKTPAEVAQVILDYGLTREMVPTEMLREAVVWEALLPAMPLMALMRNLGNLSKVGLLKPLSDYERVVVDRFAAERVRAAHLHPMQLLLALRTYSQGRGMRGKGQWLVAPRVVEALEAALDASFGAVEPTDKRVLIGVDVSGSMEYEIGSTGVRACEAAALVALAYAKREAQVYIHGFSGTFRPLGITAADTFASATKKARNQNFGSTDCALPMLHALDYNLPVDAFLVLTDNETWYGRIHPTQALWQYRERMGLPAKLVVAAFSATKFSIADPADAGQLDVVGLDASVPLVINDFLRG